MSPARGNRLGNEHDQSKAGEPSPRQDGISCLRLFIFLVVDHEGSMDFTASSVARVHVQLPSYFFSGQRTIVSTRKHQRCHYQAQAKPAQQLVGRILRGGLMLLFCEAFLENMTPRHLGALSGTSEHPGEGNWEQVLVNLTFAISKPERETRIRDRACFHSEEATAH